MKAKEGKEEDWKKRIKQEEGKGKLERRELNSDKRGKRGKRNNWSKKEDQEGERNKRKRKNQGTIIESSYQCVRV